MRRSATEKSIRVIDLVYYGNQRELEYDFLVSAGANPEQIRLSFAGAEKVFIDEAGGLVLRTSAGDVRQHRPLLYQDIDGERREVKGRYVMKGRQVGFRVGEYDRSRALVIDPVLVYSTYLGGDARTVSVSYSTADSTATSGSDYLSTSGALAFNPGETIKSISVDGDGDVMVEADETFSVLLSNPTNSVIATPVGTATILNDDIAGSLQFSSTASSVDEGAGF